MSWQSRVRSGDTSCALLQPHQALFTYQEAKLHSIKQLDLIRIDFELQQPTHLVLECVVDRRQTSNASAFLNDRSIQVHSWILEACQKLENSIATLEKVQAVSLACVWMSLPRRLSHDAPSGSNRDCLNLKGSRGEILLESMEQRHINLETLIQRQLRGTGMLRAAQERQLVPVTLLGETYPFQVDRVKTNIHVNMGRTQIIFNRWSDVIDDMRQDALVDEVTTRKIHVVNSVKINDALNDIELNVRLWQRGFVGYTAFMKDVLFNIALVLKHGHQSCDHDLKMEQIGSHGILLSGVSGVGKSIALSALNQELLHQKIKTWRIDGLSLLMGSECSIESSAYEYMLHSLEQRFKEVEFFGKNVSDQVSSTFLGVVLIDDVDVLFRHEKGQIGDRANFRLPQLGSALLRLIGELSLHNLRLVVVGTTLNADTMVPDAAKRADRFGKVLDLVIPSEQSRREILSLHLNGLILPFEKKVLDGCAVDNVASRLAELTGGYVAKDLVRVCRNATAQAYAKKLNNDESTKTYITWNELLCAQQYVKPSQLRDLNVVSPGAGMDGKIVFAGYGAVQKQLFDLISRKFYPSTAMKRLEISNASGILVSGPSGCGKTLLIKTLAAQAHVNFVSVKSSELLSKYFGDSEKAVRQLFARARAASPCLLFFDEFDSIAHKRAFHEGDGGSSGNGVYARVLSTFLNEMDGVGSQRVAASYTSTTKKLLTTNSGRILVVAATNRGSSLDAALVRPGRIDKTIEMGYPTQQDIQEILALYTKTMPLGDKIDFRDLAARSSGLCAFTGADIAAVCKEAAFRALRDNIEAKTVCLRNFEAAWDQRVDAILAQMTT